MNIVIIGAGKIGVTLTEQLAREGHNITVIDSRPEALTDIGNRLDIMTVEGLSETEIGAVLQRCFIDHGAVQCGFCTPGMLMSAYALLQQNPDPTREEIKEAIAGNLCRCTGYIPIVNSIEKAKQELLNKKQ